MNKGIYLSTLEPHSGKSLFTLGLMQALLGRTAKVAYFKPIIDDLPNGKKDNHITTILSYFNLDIPYEKAYGLKRSQVIQNRNTGKVGDSLDLIIERYKELENNYDFVLVEGTDFLGEGTVFEFDWNVNIARNLGIPTFVISTGEGKTMEEFIGSIQLAYKTFEQSDVEVIAVAANKIQPENLEAVQKEMQSFLPQNVSVFSVPMVTDLNRPTLKEIKEFVGAEVLFGEDMLSNQTGEFVVGAMQLRHYLDYLKNDSLVIAPGDRADIILGALQANISNNYPSLSGILLTGGLEPEESVLKLIEGLSQVVPILTVKGSTFEIANEIGKVKSKIYAESKDKIQSSITTFNKYVPVNDFLNKIAQFQNHVRTPRMFQYELVHMARKEKKRIVLPESLDSRILKTANRLSHQNIVEVILIGDEKQIKKKANELGLKINYDKISIVNPANYDKFNDYVETFYELRKHKNVNLDMAKDFMNDVSYFGTMMIYKGDADGMVSGAAHTTQHTIRPALQFIKTKPDSSIVSSIFFMCLEDRVSVFGDCAINPNPNAEQLAEIAIASADSATKFDIDPKIAMLSYSSGSSGKGEDVDKVRKATEMVKQKRPDLKIEGPIQYDAAVDMEVGKSKLPNSEVAGQASVLIFPDLNTGNNTYKAVQRETNAVAIGPMLQGLNKPVNDLSRGCTEDDVYNTVILTAIQAQEN